MVTHDRILPPLYMLTGMNCTAWAAKVASAAGISLPPYRLPVGIASDAVLGLSLVSLGPGTAYNGGTVIQNRGLAPTTQTKSVISVFPYDLSYTGIESAGHTNASSLSTNLGLQCELVSLGTLNANATNGITFTLAGVDPALALVSMNWGDGTPWQEQSLTLSHVYTNGGYYGDLLIIDNGAVHSYTFNVLVSSATATVSNLSITAFPPVNTPNQGLLPGNPVPNYPLPLAQSISVGQNGLIRCTFTGAPGETYEIQSSTNLQQGFVTVTNLTAGTNGVFIFDDPNAVQNRSGFYRVPLP
jgi:hypothetical protein